MPPPKTKAEMRLAEQKERAAEKLRLDAEERAHREEVDQEQALKREKMRKFNQDLEVQMKADRVKKADERKERMGYKKG